MTRGPSDRGRIANVLEECRTASFATERQCAPLGGDTSAHRSQQGGASRASVDVALDVAHRMTVIMDPQPRGVAP